MDAGAGRRRRRRSFDQSPSPSCRRVHPASVADIAGETVRGLRHRGRRLGRTLGARASRVAVVLGGRQGATVRDGAASCGRGGPHGAGHCGARPGGRDGSRRRTRRLRRSGGTLVRASAGTRRVCLAPAERRRLARGLRLGAHRPALAADALGGADRLRDSGNLDDTARQLSLGRTMWADPGGPPSPPPSTEPLPIGLDGPHSLEVSLFHVKQEGCLTCRGSYGTVPESRTGSCAVV